jgi:hypothetical protein
MVIIMTREEAFRAGFQKEANFDWDTALSESAAWGGLGAGIGTLTPGYTDIATTAAIGALAPLASEAIHTYLSEDRARN